MSDTPETDAKTSPHIGFFSCATVPAEFARRLEHERDTALDKVSELKGVIKALRSNLRETSRKT
jgi:hypothetical protein